MFECVLVKSVNRYWVEISVKMADAIDQWVDVVGLHLPNDAKLRGEVLVNIWGMRKSKGWILGGDFNCTAEEMGPTVAGSYCITPREIPTHWRNQEQVFIRKDYADRNLDRIYANIPNCNGEVIRTPGYSDHALITAIVKVKVERDPWVNMSVPKKKFGEGQINSAVTEDLFTWLDNTRTAKCERRVGWVPFLQQAEKAYQAGNNNLEIDKWVRRAQEWRKEFGKLEGPQETLKRWITEERESKLMSINEEKNMRAKRSSIGTLLFKTFKRGGAKWVVKDPASHQVVSTGRGAELIAGWMEKAFLKPTLNQESVAIMAKNHRRFPMSDNMRKALDLSTMTRGDIFKAGLMDGLLPHLNK
jgi:hypothetical protein